MASSSESGKYGSTPPYQTKLAEMVLRNFIIELSLPLALTERSAFIRAMMTADPKFRILCRRSITKEYLPKLYNKILDQLKNTSLVADFMSSTFHGWTDQRFRTFYAVTMHYVDKIGHLKELIYLSSIISQVNLPI